jgi:hypothetical protein
VSAGLRPRSYAQFTQRKTARKEHDMPMYDLDDLCRIIPRHGPDAADEQKLAALRPGEMLRLQRPEGEGWVSARRRFDLIGERLGFRLKLWWTTTGELWYVVRMK